MKILHIMAGKGNGGAEVYSTDVMAGLHRAGVEQCVVMRPNAPGVAELRSYGVRVVTEVFGTPLRFGQRRRLAKLIEAERPDIVQCWMRRAASLLPPAPRGSGPVVGWFGDYEELKHFTRCTHLVGCTQDIADAMVSGGRPVGEAAYIPTFPTIAAAPAVDRAALDTPAAATVLLTLSRLDPVKGLDTMLQALALLPGVYLWMTGEGPSRAGLEQLADRLGVRDRVRFLGWRTDRGALLDAADICVLPSRYEPFGTVILEAWCTRTPLVACAAAGPKAHVRDGRNGLLAAIDDPQDLARAVTAVMADPGLAASIVQHGYDDYAERFTEAAVMRRWLGYYAGLLGRSG